MQTACEGMVCISCPGQWFTSFSRNIQGILPWWELDELWRKYQTFCHYWILNLFYAWSRRLGTADERKTYFLTDEGWRETQLPKLPPNSLIYGEFVNREGNDRQMSRLHTVFHVIDVGFLDGRDLSKLTVYMRYDNFCKELAQGFLQGWAILNQKLYP